MAALAVHVPAEDWGDGGIVNWLRDEMNSHPEVIPSFLELLRVLPEVYMTIWLFAEGKSHMQSSLLYVLGKEQLSY